MCTGSITDCIFEQAGNDGLDLMSCNVRVVGCSFIDCGDKGVSVGEGTTVLVERAEIRGCTIGMEVKDASRAVVVDSVFDGNGTAWHSYQKKWQYSKGGEGVLVRSEILNSRNFDVDLQARSTLLLVATTIYTVSRGEKRISRMESVTTRLERAIEEMRGQ